MKGSVIKYERDNIDTDVILPGPYLKIHDYAELATHAMEGLDKDFHKRVKPGDFIVAGKNFGCGSSREHAPIALSYSGIKAVLALSFARIFYRNAVDGAFLLPIEIDESASAPVTLFIRGPKLREWGFHCASGWRHHSDFHTRGCDS